MKKKVIGLTLAGMLALPLVSGGQAHAATQPQEKTCPQAFTNLLNPWKLKDQQLPDLNELLSKLGISLDLTQLQEQIQNQADAQTPEKVATPTPQKEQTPKAEAPKADAPKTETPQKAEPQKSEQPAANNNSSNTGNQPSSNSQMNAFEQKVVDLTNQERTKAGLKPLKADNSTLSKMARAKSQDMSDKNYFDHQSPTYGSPFDMMKQFGITYRSAGENIAAGQKTPEEVVNGWMNSPGHRANILNASYTTIGVGYVQGGSYGSYWTQEFIGN
ncbi:CAP domain-containing protein [Sporolactobacillus kofuensis]|uniref:CAP domain-containing protein n=1 Tax=Sporolactobacillus kofuensis TaxID=269672 RepID=A0ABW1WF20_9BACL|nr:CAP domain-containing protein [Sporolactobacillus kofuensis]MCO7176063.1 CAP domain-containing protein [Sporolactobacillus kofuensis]